MSQHTRGLFVRLPSPVCSLAAPSLRLPGTTEKTVPPVARTGGRSGAGCPVGAPPHKDRQKGEQKGERQASVLLCPIVAVRSTPPCPCQLTVHPAVPCPRLGAATMGAHGKWTVCLCCSSAPIFESICNGRAISSVAVASTACRRSVQRPSSFSSVPPVPSRVLRPFDAGYTCLLLHSAPHRRHQCRRRRR
jgi:hypothetical protein